MALVIAHKILRNKSVGLGGRPYKINDRGVLVPQPSPEEAKQILMLRAYALVEDDGGAAPSHPGLTPPKPDVPDAPAKSSVEEVLAVTRALDGVAPVEGVAVPAATLLPPDPEDAPDTIDYSALSRDDLLEIARARGIPGLKGKTKAQLLSLVRGD